MNKSMRDFCEEVRIFRYSKLCMALFKIDAGTVDDKGNFIPGVVGMHSDFQIKTPDEMYRILKNNGYAVLATTCYMMKDYERIVAEIRAKPEYIDNIIPISIGLIYSHLFSRQLAWASRIKK